MRGAEFAPVVFSQRENRSMFAAARSKNLLTVCEYGLDHLGRLSFCCLGPTWFTIATQIRHSHMSVIPMLYSTLTANCSNAAVSVRGRSAWSYGQCRTAATAGGPRSSGVEESRTDVHVHFVRTVVPLCSTLTSLRGKSYVERIDGRRQK